MGRSSTSLPDHGGVRTSSPRLPSVSVVVPYAGPVRYLATVLQAILESDYPKRLLQLVVGILLTTFGTFWALEGLGVEWPAGDGAILGLLALYLVTAGTYISLERRRVLGFISNA